MSDSKQLAPTITITLVDTPYGCQFKLEKHNYTEELPLQKSELIADFLMQCAVEYSNQSLKNEPVIGGVN